MSKPTKDKMSSTLDSESTFSTPCEAKYQCTCDVRFGPEDRDAGERAHAHLSPGVEVLMVFCFFVSAICDLLLYIGFENHAIRITCTSFSIIFAFTQLVVLYCESTPSMSPHLSTCACFRASKRTLSEVILLVGGSIGLALNVATLCLIWYSSTSGLVADEPVSW
ncbi:uncharacterized protein I303_105925 [Kwoniella dejecticola CBS 10117]|uniref:Uncharacterized protein n=1 Tax=Kwoniella dejecticola CBS 10117 TaxID=1296121 RepID=A0A1A6A0T9_9TREE|nr:uncharacterized protein I303_05948 [Kwoniella dejecticola CBS 10117]OBR83668.1 hypothetical protein I303_05948 [Kwoniella dejecticola CBS 10117]